MAPIRSRLAAAAVAVLVGGCASVSPDGGVGDVQALSRERVQGAPVPLATGPSATSRATVAALLTRPLDMDAAVQVALLNNPGLHAALAALGVSDADRAQAGRPIRISRWGAWWRATRSRSSVRWVST